MRILSRLFYICTICATSFIAWLCLNFFRVLIVEPNAISDQILKDYLRVSLANSEDFLFLLLLAIAFSGLCALFGKFRKIVFWIWIASELVLAATVAYGFANIELNRMLGEPFTFQWLLYADFLQSGDSHAALGESSNLANVGLMTGSVFAVLLLGLAGGKLISDLLTKKAAKATSVTALGLALVGLSAFQIWPSPSQIPVLKFRNPIAYFLSSLIFNSRPVLFTMATKSSSRDFETLDAAADTKPWSNLNSDQKIKNVVIFVFESTPWEYVQPFGGTFPVTPNLEKYASDARLFTNAYAPAPATGYSLFSLFTSLYPEISYRSVSSEHTTVPFNTIASVLSSKGFATSFFWSQDSRFQSFDRFLNGKGFDTVQDYRAIKCNREVVKLSDDHWKNMDLIYDPCTAQAMSAWISTQGEKPFFSVIMTAMTHYPYVTNTTKESYTSDEKLNSYLNALKIGDETFGIVMDGLAKSGKLDSTLVVVLGDHGEAFGQHNNFVHASAIYEENMHIPLMLINGSRFNGERSTNLASVIDIAPTILDTLGLSSPGEWQGRSLLSNSESRRIFFFSPWSGYKFGFREGTKKVLYNASTNKIESYNLAVDPRETINLEPTGEASRDNLDPIAAWVQYQTLLMKNHFEKLRPVSTDCALASVDFESGGTNISGAPKLAVRVDDNLVGTVDIDAAIPSHATNAQESIAEMQVASQHLKRYSIKFAQIKNVKKVEVRFLNDLWLGDNGGGDRNVFIKSIFLNGMQQSVSKFVLDDEKAGKLDEEGAAIYSNAAITISRPFEGVCR